MLRGLLDVLNPHADCMYLAIAGLHCWVKLAGGMKGALQHWPAAGPAQCAARAVHCPAGTPSSPGSATTDGGLPRETSPASVLCPGQCPLPGNTAHAFRGCLARACRGVRGQHCRLQSQLDVQLRLGIPCWQDWWAVGRAGCAAQAAHAPPASAHSTVAGLGPHQLSAGWIPPLKTPRSAMRSHTAHRCLIDTRQTAMQQWLGRSRKVHQHQKAASSGKAGE